MQPASGALDLAFTAPQCQPKKHRACNPSMYCTRCDRLFHAHGFFAADRQFRGIDVRVEACAFGNALQAVLQEGGTDMAWNNMHQDTILRTAVSPSLNKAQARKLLMATK